MNKIILPTILIIMITIGRLYGDTNSLESIALIKQLTSVTRLLNEYKNTNCPTCILDALIAMVRVPAVNLSELQMDPETRNQKTEAWLDFLATLDMEIDPQFDTNEVVYLKVAPPPPPDGEVVWPPDVNPKLIKNDKIRSEYEAAIRANSDRNKNHEYQVILRRIEKIAHLDVENFIKTYYSNSDRDKHELHELLTNIRLSNKIKEHYEQLLQ